MLTKKSKYALKAMLRLADAQRTDKRPQAKEIAEQEQIPLKFLVLILFELRSAGLVEGHRGKFGGYSLSRPADRITAGQIMRAIDGPLAPIGCASVHFYERCEDCEDERACMVRQMMREVRDSAAAILDQTTLADALKGKPRRTRLQKA